MKFRVKMTLWMLAVLSLLFGAGGSLLISGFFNDSLEREKDAAFSSYRMAWSALQIVNGLDPYLDTEAIAGTMEQLCQQNRSVWSALFLSTEDAVLYQSGAALSGYLQELAPPEPGSCLIRLVRVVRYGLDSHYLILSGVVETNGEALCLHTAHDVSTLYAMRRSQQRTYLRVFGVMALLCAAASYTVSRSCPGPPGPSPPGGSPAGCPSGAKTRSPPSPRTSTAWRSGWSGTSRSSTRPWSGRSGL